MGGKQKDEDGDLLDIHLHFIIQWLTFVQDYTDIYYY